MIENAGFFFLVVCFIKKTQEDYGLFMGCMYFPRFRLFDSNFFFKNILRFASREKEREEEEYVRSELSSSFCFPVD